MTPEEVKNYIKNSNPYSVWSDVENGKIPLKEWEKSEWTIKIQLNDVQTGSFYKMIRDLRGSHNADLKIRKNGEDIKHEVDWLQNAGFERTK